MNHSIHGAHFVTEQNLEDLVLTYKEHLHPTHLGNSTDPEPGDVIVIRRITSLNPFDRDLTYWHEIYWLATREEFDDRFELVGDGDSSEEFVLIRPKKK